MSLPPPPSIEGSESALEGPASLVLRREHFGWTLFDRHANRYHAILGSLEAAKNKINLLFPEAASTLKIVESQPSESWLSGPFALTINPTFRCTNRCFFCSYGDQVTQFRRYPEGLTVDSIVRLVTSELHPFQVHFLGGEPFLSRVTAPALDALLDYGVEVGATTIGAGLRHDWATKFVQRGGILRLSLHGSTPQLHGMMVSNMHSFDTVVGVINALRGQVGRIEVFAVVSHKNFSDIQNVISLAASMDVTDLWISEPYAVGWGVKSLDQRVPRPQLAAAFREWGRMAADLGLRLHPVMRFKFLFDGSVPTSSHERPSPAIELYTDRHAAGRTELIIYPNGHLYPSEELVGPEWDLGDGVGDGQAHEIWSHSPLLQQLRALPKSERCAQCAWDYRCHGGSPAVTYNLTGVVEYPSAECPIVSGEVDG